MAARKRGQGAPVELASLPHDPPPPLPASGDEPQYVVMQPPTASEIRAERELDDILQEIGGGDVKVKVSRFGDSGAPQSCGEMAGDSFSMEALTDTFGGGRYLLRFMRGRQEVAKTRVEVDPLIPPRNPRAPKGAVAVPGSNGMDVMPMVTGMIGMMMQSMSAQQTATLTMISGMAEMMKARPQEKDPMDTALRMAEVMRANPGQNPVDLFAIFEKGMNVAAKMNGSDGDEVLPLVGEGVKGIVALMEGIGAEKKASAARMAGEQAPPAVTSGPPVAVVSAPVPTPTPPAAPVNARPWVLAVLPFRDQFGGMMAFFSPATAATAILDKLSDDQLDDLLNDIEDVSEPGFVRRAFAVLRPGVALTDDAVRWLAECAGAIVEQTESETEPETPAAAAGAENPTDG